MATTRYTSLYWRRWGCAAVFAQARMRMARMPSVGASRAEETRARRTVDCDDAEDPFGATAFEADEAGYGVERMARQAA